MRLSEHPVMLLRARSAAGDDRLGRLMVLFSRCRDLGLLRALTTAMRAVLGCAKTCVALFAEAEGFEHVHFYVVPRSPDIAPGGCAARACSHTSAVIQPVMCLPR